MSWLQCKFARVYFVHQDPVTPQKKIITVCGDTAIAVLAAKALRRSGQPRWLTG
jgi:hypothetical protein